MTYNYNPEQQRIIDSQDSNMIVVACAGSGKTNSIVGAIHKYRQLHPLEHICAITFTRKATEDLSMRIDDRSVEVSTIHSWAYRRLQRYARKYEFKIQLLEEPVIKDILKKLCAKRKQFYINQFLLYSYVMGNFNVDVDEKIERIFKVISDDYVKFKRINRLYDFTDLPLYLLDICQEYDETITDIDALFVDEFQDIDPVQLRVFDRVICRKRVYIGDPKQAIYAFRGACSDIFETFRDDEKWSWYNLSLNYRSKQEIVDFAEQQYANAVEEINKRQAYNITASVDEVNSSQITCVRGNCGTVVVTDEDQTLRLNGKSWECVDEDMATQFLANLITQRETQILCRTNKQVKKLTSMGIERVSTVHQAKGLEYGNVVLVDFEQKSEEDYNIAYVAMTRARDSLYVVDWNTMLYTVSNMNCGNIGIEGIDKKVNTSTVLF